MNYIILPNWTQENILAFATTVSSIPRNWASQVVLVVKTIPANAGDVRDIGSISGSGGSPGEGNGLHSSILAWKIPYLAMQDRVNAQNVCRINDNIT